MAELREHRGVIHEDRRVEVVEGDPDAAGRFAVAPADVVAELGRRASRVDRRRDPGRVRPRAVPVPARQSAHEARRQLTRPGAARSGRGGDHQPGLPPPRRSADRSAWPTATSCVIESPHGSITGVADRRPTTSSRASCRCRTRGVVRSTDDDVRGHGVADQPAGRQRRRLRPDHRHGRAERHPRSDSAGRTAEMRAALITGAGQVEIREFPDPTPSDDGVVVDVTFCGVCGTDVQAYTSGRAYTPAICGHEWTGTVSAVGRSVARCRRGRPGRRRACPRPADRASPVGPATPGTASPPHDVRPRPRPRRTPPRRLRPPDRGERRSGDRGPPRSRRRDTGPGRAGHGVAARSAPQRPPRRRHRRRSSAPARSV